jgi:NTP pyrophosphatase (non-canonical NTP hydrolase)
MSQDPHPVNEPPKPNRPAEPLTIAEFQRHIRDRYYEADSARGTPATFLWFIEEVGELATALHGEDRQNLEEEFADVLAWLNTLANINGVDLEAAVTRKYLPGKGPEGHK